MAAVHQSSNRHCMFFQEFHFPFHNDRSSWGSQVDSCSLRSLLPCNFEKEQASTPFGFHERGETWGPGEFGMFWKWDPNICWKWDNRKWNWRKVHGREAFCLHTVQLLLHNCWQSQDAFANPFRRKTFQLHTVWILLHKGILPQETHVGAFRREAFQVWPVELFMRSGYYASSTH